MKLQNEYIAEDGARTTIIPIGNGNPDLSLKLEERLGVGKVYRLKSNNWTHGHIALVESYFYGLEEEDYHLFNAYDALEEGMEMVGYGDFEKLEDGYDYFLYDGRVKEFFVNPHFGMSEGLIYARRKQEVEQPVKTININGYDVPEPVRELEVGDDYFVASVVCVSKPHVVTWQDDTIDNQYLSDGLIHRTQEDAEIHVKALKSFTREQVTLRGRKQLRKAHGSSFIL